MAIETWDGACGKRRVQIKAGGMGRHGSTDSFRVEPKVSKVIKIKYKGRR